MRKIILLFVIYFSSASALWAVELDVQAEQAFWRYKEYPKLHLAKSEGSATLAKVRLSSERNQSWFAGVTASMLSSTAWSDEMWQTTKANELRIQQVDTRLDLQYRMLGARFGIWFSQRRQTQERRNFYMNNGPVTGNPVSEEIATDWAGLSLTSVGGNAGQLEMSVDAAVPVNVKLDSARFNQPYKKDGYRAGMHIRWTLPRQEVGISGLNLTLGYEYQKLGGEPRVGSGYWPYNSWQVASAGILYAW